MKLITLENLKNFWKDVKSYVDNGLSKKADSSHGTHVSYGTINGKEPGTPSAGTSSKVAREDHVHPVQTTVSGNAGSATKLATARTINGTSFNGTANITTANWGTARTLTIGNTGKSVNGSANVSWSLSEIGAAPAGYGLGTTCQDKSNQDCNNILVTGFYMGSNMTNKPSGCTQGWIYLLVMRHNDSWVRQVAYDFGTASQVYTRVKQNGSWTSWVATDNNTWRGVQDNLTSTATDQSLSANQGKVLKGLIDGKAAASHTHNYAGSSSAGGNANAAVKLATARSINGTNFDGTGNITTANWGTARNIQIGNTAKSVNGSANVTWSLSEIGAAASNHTHSYLPLSGGTMTGGIKFSGGGYNNHAIRMEAGDSNGAFIGIGAGGLTVIGSGESMSVVRDNITNGSDETMIVASDQTIRFLTGVQNGYSSAKEVSINAAGVINAPQGMSGNASTATKLQTARKINGTSFDGSANITTANWGTARNIQIGNTSKSVNGSANVAWTLGEIGAAASNHTHGLVNLNSEAFSGGNDLNTYNSTKTWVARTLNSTTNKPADYFTVVNFGANSNSNFQLAHSYANNSTLYVRGRHDTSGNYTPWAKIYTDKNKPTASEIGAAAASHTHNYAGSSSAGGNANAAVKLATARTINGTNFDGTGNITTANWGTARTLTIGNTGKSVNGSGNVSWSLSEIGALPLAGGTLSGRLTVNGRISAPTAGSSWISGMTVDNATIGISTQQSENAYHPVLAVKTSGNHVANIGGIGNDFGFYGFKSGRTENGTDWSFKISAGTGAVSSTGNITAPTFVGALSGNASTATKATQDSAGQQINKTYIKGLSVNGKTITYTKGDGTTGTITTQDTNTTYSVGTASALGLTKLYTGTGTATDGTMTQNAIKTALDGKAASSHTHSYLPLSGGTVTGQTIFNNYLTLNAWSGYGTGTAQMWYDGNAKMLNIQNATGLKVGSNTVYHSGNFNPNDKADKSTLCTSWNWDDFNWRINNHHGLCSMTINQGGNASGLYEWGAGLTFGGTNSSAQFYSPHVGEEMYWRSKWRDDSVRGWHRIWHSGNMAAPHWGTGAPNNSDGRPDGTVYYRYA